MANKRQLKKEINYVIGDILEIVYLHELTTKGSPSEATEALVKECFETFDDLVTKINDSSVEHQGKHLKAVKKEFESRAMALVEKVNAL